VHTIRQPTDTQTAIPVQTSSNPGPVDTSSPSALAGRWQLHRSDQQSYEPLPFAALSLISLAYLRSRLVLAGAGNTMGSRLVLPSPAIPRSGGAMAAWPVPRISDRGGGGGTFRLAGKLDYPSPYTARP
jgi:hypothetical protein